MLSQEIISEIVGKGLMSLDWQKEPQNLYEPVEYIMSIGGKHLRPHLCLTVYNLFSDNITQSIVWPAMALEVFHQFTLLHDDIMDKSDTRRGRPTVHCKWSENTAILSGDLMSIMAYRFLSQGPADKIPALLKVFTDMAVAVCEGQQKDMDFEKTPFITMNDYIDMISQKTGALIGGSACIGAILAGRSEAVCKAFHDFGMNVGISFQIMDDYLDTFGDAKIFGKPIGGDIANGKKTWLLVETFRRCVTESQKKVLDDIVSIPEDEKERKFSEMSRLYTELGVKDDAAKAIHHYYNLAVEALDRAGLNGDQTEVLRGFAQKLLNREK